MKPSVVLLILDGWGINPSAEWNAVAQGDTPVIDRLNRERPYVPIAASGEEVGLPAGQMGNSEVGHLNIGAGRVVFQEIQRVTNAIGDESFYKLPVYVEAMKRAKLGGKAVHLLGLVSDGGVHSHIEHIYGYLELAKRHGVGKVFIHAFTDGRDTPPDSGAGFLAQLEEAAKRIGVGEITSVVGRFYAMDRDNRWDRVNKAYDLMIHGQGARYANVQEAMANNYGRNVTDEFIEPSLIAEDGVIREGDEVLMINFRADRMREIVRALHEPHFEAFARGMAPKVNVTCLTEYDARFGLPVAFAPTSPRNGLGEILAARGLAQLRTAETEKYAHVTFFFNGGVEEPNPGETRKLIPSPKVRTYDLKPEMSCQEVTQTAVEAITSGLYSLIVINLANGDMVGHTGVWEAALEAVKTVDTAVGRIMEACWASGTDLLITADHGNIETMREHGKPMTAHTTNPVPFYYVGAKPYTLRAGGRLADIAPTILKLLEIPQPDEMTGKSLVG